MKVTILGAGITGVSLGSYLADRKFDVEVLEKTGKIGGMAASFKYKGHTLDFGPHKIYSQIPGIIPEYHKIAKPDKLLKVKKKNSLYLLGKFFSFPAKIPQLVLGINPVKSAMLGAGFGLSTMKGLFSRKKLKTYEEYFVAGFGRPAYNLLFKDLAWKVWGNPETLSEELGRKRVPVPNVMDMLFSRKKKDGKEISAEHFYYPKHGGIGFISQKYTENIEKKHGKIILSALPVKISTKNKKAVSVTYKTESGLHELKTDFVANTIYLKDFVEMMEPKAPSKVITAAKNLKYRSLVLVYLIVNKPKVLKDNWVFFPEKKYVFSRISEHNSFSKFIVEKGKAIITAEIPCEFGSDLYNGNDNYLFRRVMDDLEKAEILQASDVEEYLVRKAGRVYPVYDINYRNNLKVILDYLDGFDNIITLGRQGLYNYNNTDHCIDMSLKASDYIDRNSKGEATVEDWQKTREYFDNYTIVD